MHIEHLEEVTEIEQSVYPSPWSINSFSSEIQENSLAFYFVALLKNKVIGYAGIWIILDEAHITNLAVHPGYQCQNVGSMLLKHLIVEAFSYGAIRMSLEVRCSNIRAQKLYLRHGFVVRGVRTKYYSDEDALIMWLDNLGDNL